MSYKSSKYALILLNMAYVMVAFVLIGVATYGKTSNIITSLEIVGGIVASGVFLLFIAVAGLFGAIRHHQVTLFVYMMVLLVLFVIQFSVSCACLAVSTEKQIAIALKGWELASNETRFTAEKNFHCCGFVNSTVDGYNCDKIPECYKDEQIICETCLEKIKDKIGYAFSASGGVGLFFSFTEFIAVVFAFKFRRENANYVA